MSLSIDPKGLSKKVDTHDDPDYKEMGIPPMVAV
jgi:hypothetical protein